MIEEKPATGEALDRIAHLYGFKRNIFWIFRERDKALRKRIVAWIKDQDWYLK